MTRILSLALMTTFMLPVGCGGAAAPSPATPESGVTAAPAPSTGTSAADDPAALARAQIERGARLYADNCAGCHGDQGQGSDEVPPVVGPGALPLDPPRGAKFRTTRFRTALDVAQFVVEAMPPPPAEKLTEDEYWAILAFDLSANGVALSEPVGPDLAASIVLHE